MAFKNFLKRSSKKPKTVKRKTVRTTSIQGMGCRIEGGQDPLDIESLMYLFNNQNRQIGGTCNGYKTYAAQVFETYRKYNSESDWGNYLARAVIDIRSAFISGEGITVSCPNDRTAKWINNFLDLNGLNGSPFVEAVKGGEMSGKSLFTLKAMKDEFGNVSFVKTYRVPFKRGNDYKVQLANEWDPESIIDVVKSSNGIDVSLGLSNFIYIRLGGDDCEVNQTTTKVGACLTNIENYDRAQKDMRRLNYLLARITPFFKCETAEEAKELKEKMTAQRWQVGDAFIGTADLSYVNVGTQAHQNLTSEMTTEIENISSVTNVPVHWLGHAELLKNRATAETLYDVVKNGTTEERQTWSSKIKEMIIKAMEIYINAGGTEITEVDKEFSVSIPLVDLSQILSIVQAYSLAYNDNVITREDYQAQIPGIDQLKTNKKLEENEKSEFERLKADADTEASIRKQIETESEEGNNE